MQIVDIRGTYTSAAPRVSIVVATLNRRDMLERSVTSLATQDYPRDQFEVLVVDNGCTDDTPQLMAQLMERFPNVRYVREPKLGLSNARNRGIAESTGTLVAFFDDDATADPPWLGSLLAAFDVVPEAGAAGGPIVVGWPSAKPAWMPASCEGYYGHCDYGSERIELKYPQYPYGSNMVIRRDVLDHVGGFRPDLGVCGRNLMAAEELDLFARINQLGARVVYEPSALVHHWPPADRVSRRWLMRRAYRHGVSGAQMSLHSADSSRVPHRPSHALMRSLVATAATLVAAITLRKQRLVWSRATCAAYWAGIVRGLLFSPSA